MNLTSACTDSGLSTGVTIRCNKLTTCNALDDGETVKLDLVDVSGNPVSLLLSSAHAESIAMTLPRLLTHAVKKQTRQDNSRYVFPLGQWLLEAIEDCHSFILTLKTEDGFEVSFRISHDASRALGRTLQQEADDATETAESPAARARSETTEFN
jgi:hypothetical protein